MATTERSTAYDIRVTASDLASNAQTLLKLAANQHPTDREWLNQRLEEVAETLSLIESDLQHLLDACRSGVLGAGWTEELGDPHEMPIK